MTLHQDLTVQRGVEIQVPLSKLKPSPRNARKTGHAKADVETLAASIAVKGLLQPPVVEPERDAEGQETGAYLVTIGEGRRLALSLMAKRKLIAKNTPVRCLLDADNDAFEISLDENVTRFALSPADQFEAFRDLADQKGWSAEEIAARFGVSAQLVRQRLRLGAVSPELMAAYRAGDLTLDQLMAFAVSEDHARQAQVFASLSFNRSPSHIRRMMTEHEAPAADRRAILVGAEAYEAAGGRIRHDLFADDQGGWFEDVGLLDRLVTEKLTAEADRVRTEEGWRWAEAHLDYPHDHGLGRLYPRETPPDEATQARLSGLAEEYDAIVADLAEDERVSETVEARLKAIEAELEAAARPVYSPDDIARAGVFVVLGWEGDLRIERGLIRQEDLPAEVEVEPVVSEGGQAAASANPAGNEDQTCPKPLADRLISDLTAHRTAALRDLLAGREDVALAAALHALVLQTFDVTREDSCLDLRATTSSLRGFAEAYDQSVAGQAVAARHEAWAKRLAEGGETMWMAILGFSEQDRISLFAHCVSLTVNAVQSLGRSHRALTQANELATCLGLDMTRYWQATAETYFGRVSKAQILDAVREAKSPEAAAKLEGMKKEAMAKAAADLLGPEGWLPPLLKPAAVPST